MATMNPVLRLRRAFRSISEPQPMSGEAADEVAEEAADAVSDYSYSRQESDLRFERMMAEMRQQTAEMREHIADQTNRILLGVLVIVSIAVGIILAFVA